MEIYFLESTNLSNILIIYKIFSTWEHHGGNPFSVCPDVPLEGLTV
jgi:hypothetical protein